MEQNHLDLGHVIEEVSRHEAFSNKQEEINRLANAYKLAQNAPTYILVCGEFNRGKSTFVNALLGHDLCATETTVCTSVVSQIKYGEKEKVTRYYGDFSNIQHEEIELNQLEKFTVGSADKIGNTLYVEIELPNPILNNGWVIIDTPGIGGLDPRHASMTNFFLPRADIALFITDVNEPLTRSEVDFFKDKVEPYCKQFAVVVNKADLKDATIVEDFRKDTINKFATAAQLSHNQVEAVAVSSAAEAYPEDYDVNSNFDELRELINSLVKKYRDSIKCDIRDQFIELLNLAIAPIQAQLNQIEQPDVDQLASLNQQKAEIESRIRDLTNPNSNFRISINEHITSKREVVLNQVSEASKLLQQILKDLSKNPYAQNVKGGEWVGEKLNDKISEIKTNLMLEMQDSFEEISALPEFEGLLQYNIKDFTSKIGTLKVDTSVPLNKRLSTLASGTPTAFLTGGALSLLGTLVGVSLGPLGILASIAAGAYVSLSNVSDMEKANIESKLKEAYMPEIATSITKLQTYVTTRFQEFQYALINAITQRANAFKDSLQESIDSIQAIREEINKAVSLKMQLQNKLNPLVEAKVAANKMTF